MRIIVSGYVGKKITGIGRSIISLLNEAEPTDEYILYTNYDIVSDLNISNKNIHVIPYHISKEKSMQNLLWTTFIFPFLAISHKASVAIIPNFTLLLFKFVPTVIFLHDLIEFNVKNKFTRLKMFYRKYLADPISARNATKIITVSYNSKNDIIRFLKIEPEKVHVVYNGVDRAKFHPVPREIANNLLKSNGITSNFILYTGTIDHPGKNVLGIIKAYEMLRGNSDYIGDLILAGMPGSGHEVIFNYIEKSDHKKSIKLLGYVSDDTLVSLLSSCDVFCFVSFYEGFGIPPLEAISCGAKIVVSNTSSLPELFSDIGEIVDPSSIVSIFTGIKNQLSNNQYNMKNIIIEEKLEQFNWNKQYQNLIGVINNINKRNKT